MSELAFLRDNAKPGQSLFTDLLFERPPRLISHALCMVTSFKILVVFFFWPRV